MPRCTESAARIWLPGPMPNSLPGPVDRPRHAGPPGRGTPTRAGTAESPVEPSEIARQLGRFAPLGRQRTRRASDQLSWLAAAARAGTTAGGVGRLAGAGQSATGHDQVLVADGFVGEEVFEDFTGAGSVAGLGGQRGARDVRGHGVVRHAAPRVVGRRRLRVPHIARRNRRADRSSVLPRLRRARRFRRGPC